MNTHSKLKNKATIFGIIGYGKFGQLLSQLLLDHTQGRIFVCARRNIITTNPRIRAVSFDVLKDCNYIFPCVSIPALEEVVDQLKPVVSKHQVLIDISSVKTHPFRVTQSIKDSCQVLLSHPMFGPGTVKQNAGKTKNLTITVQNISTTVENYQQFISWLKNDLLLNIIEIDADTHDKLAAQFHFTAHYINQLLKKLDLNSSSIDTYSYHQLLIFRDMIETEPELLKQMLQFNPYCQSQFELIKEQQLLLNQFLIK